MKKIITVIAAIAVTLAAAISLSGCSDATVVNYNMSREANYFNCLRRITVYNARTDTVILEMEGYMSISNDIDDELIVTCKVGEDRYKKEMSGEFKEEYIQLVRGGQTRKATDLAKKLEVVGIDEAQRTKWLEDAVKDEMRADIEDGDSRTARKRIDELLTRHEDMDESDILSSLNSSYMSTYYEYRYNGQTKKAEELAATLQALNIHNSKGEEAFRQEWMDEQYEKWVKRKEEE